MGEVDVGGVDSDVVDMVRESCLKKAEALQGFYSVRLEPSGPWNYVIFTGSSVLTSITFCRAPRFGYPSV